MNALDAPVTGKDRLSLSITPHGAERPTYLVICGLLQ